MRRSIIIASIAVGALALAGLAAATQRATGITPATATFTTSADHARTTSCVGGGNTFKLLVGRFNGKADFASPNDDLDGDLSLAVKAAYNTNTKLGWLEGTFRTKNDRRSLGTIRGVLGESGGQITLSGFVNGSAKRGYARLLGGVAATLKTDSSGSIVGIDGTLGQGSVAMPAVLAGATCTGSKPEKPNTPVKLFVKGTISALSSSSISVLAGAVGTQTCAIISGVSPSTSGFEVNQKVEMSCGVVNGNMTLLRLKRDR